MEAPISSLESLPQEVMGLFTEQLSPTSIVSLAGTSRYLRSLVPTLPQRLEIRDRPLPREALGYFSAVQEVRGPILVEVENFPEISRRVRGNLHLVGIEVPEIEDPEMEKTVTSKMVNGIQDLLLTRARLYPMSEFRLEWETSDQETPILDSLYRPGFLVLSVPLFREHRWYLRTLSLIRDLPLTGFGLLGQKWDSQYEGELREALGRKDIRELMVKSSFPPGSWGGSNFFPHLQTVTFYRSHVHLLDFFPSPRPLITTINEGLMEIMIFRLSDAQSKIQKVTQKLFERFPRLTDGSLIFIIRGRQRGRDETLESFLGEIPNYFSIAFANHPHIAISIKSDTW